MGVVYGNWFVKQNYPSKHTKIKQEWTNMPAQRYGIKATTLGCPYQKVR